jgi:hypothetical protein
MTPSSASAAPVACAACGAPLAPPYCRVRSLAFGFVVAIVLTVASVAIAVLTA